MSDESIFLVYCELAGDSRALRDDGLAGAFVTCLVATNNIADAINQSNDALTADGYIVIDIDKALRFAADEWSSDDEITIIARDVQRDRKLRYTNFEVWGH